MDIMLSENKMTFMAVIYWICGVTSVLPSPICATTDYRRPEKTEVCIK